MGFSLEGFLSELREIIESGDMDEQDKLSALEDAIAEGYNYALECGAIKE